MEPDRALLASGTAAPAAFAHILQPNGGEGTGTVQALRPSPVHVVVSGGMPCWQTALIAVGAALTAMIAVTLDRSQAARRHVTAPLPERYAQAGECLSEEA